MSVPEGSDGRSPESGLTWQTVEGGALSVRCSCFGRLKDDILGSCRPEKSNGCERPL